MRELVLLLIIFYSASAWSQDFDFTCGLSQILESEINQTEDPHSSTSVDYRSGQIRTQILFSKFNGAEDPFDLRMLGDREGELNQSADSLLSVTHEGSLAHYFHNMSNGILTLVPGSGGVNLTRYEATGDSISDYKSTGGSCLAGLKIFVTEVLINANSGNYSDVDMIAVIVPMEFLKCSAAGTIFSDKFDNGIQINNVALPDVITTIELQSFPLIVGILAHEYGHAMRLPELYDRSVSGPYAAHGAGIGLWGVMGTGPVGWRRGEIEGRLFSSGPTAMSAWSRMRVGWITPETVSADILGIGMHDINNSADGKVFKIPMPNSDKEYFLVENRQNMYSETKNTSNVVGSYYDDYAPVSGLAIWHVDDTVGFLNTANTDIDDEDAGTIYRANLNEFHKRVDLECADGLFSDKGYNPDNIPNSPNSVSGGDNLDYISSDSTYTVDHHGNLGDATDLWDGETYTAFTPYTNPSAAGYNDNDLQNVFTGIALHNIRSSSSGVMQVDIYLQYWSGSITEDTTWSGRITVGGDVTIPSGVTLTIASGTVVRFVANSDDTASGNDTTRSELIVADGGALTAEAGNIIFRSINDNLTGPEWYGIRVESGGSATLTNVTVRDGVHCAKAAAGGTLDQSNVHLDNCGTPPTISDNTNVSVDEGATAVATYTATDAEDDMVTWSLVATDENDDVGAFTIAAAGQLRFNDPPDFETLNGDTTYQIVVRATDSQRASAEVPVTVTVANVEELGTVAFDSTSPRVGDPLTAELSDPDEGITDTCWTWQRAAEADGAWTDIANDCSEAAPTLSSYTPVSDDVGFLLRVRVRYRDGQSGDTFREVVSAPTEAVAAPANAPPGWSGLAGSDTVAMAENRIEVHAYEAIDPEGERLTWALSGADSSLFALGPLDADMLAKGAELRPLQFKQPPNYEQPTDQGANNIYEVTITVDDGHTSVPLDITVTVGDADDAGVIEFSPSVPKAGQPITATLTDEDGGLESVVWGWDNVEVSAQAGVAANSMTSTVLVPSGWVGDAIRVLVFYADALGPGKEAEGQTAVVEADVPAAPGDLTATGGNGQVVVTWTTPADHGAAISGYEYRSSDDGGTMWDPDWTPIDDSSKDTTEHTVLGLANGTEYTLEIRAVNSAGPGAAAQATATPSNQPPTLTGPDTPDDFAENGTGAIASYTASDPEGDALTWTLSGADANLFAWGEGTTTRPLQFKQPPNYEQPTDQDDNNDYEVTVAASDGSASTTIAVTVTVANANDPGVITLSTTTPRANRSITATLSDEDGVTGTVAWNDGYWSPSNTEERGKSDAKAANGTPNLTHTFTMAPDKVGWRFQAYAHYTDALGPDSAQSDPTDPIGEDNRPPCSPTAFEATGSDEQVALSWSAPTGTNCADLTHYAYRYKETSGGRWSETKDVGTATSVPEKDATNDITYTFELRAARLF